jgi:thiamine-phosphate pyrophosphorylase
MSGATGVHVGQGDLRPADARALLGPDAVIGRSTHDAAQVAATVEEPVSYVAVGPVFQTATKETGYAALGLAAVSMAVRRAAGRPVVAIGGITLETVAAVIAAGASGVAVIGDLLTGGDPAARTAAYVALLGAARSTGVG